MKQLTLSLLVCLLLYGCASVQPVTTFDPNRYTTAESRQCSELIKNVESSISKNNAVDSQAKRLKPYPYLRVNRFLSEFRFVDLDEQKFDAWLQRMQQLAVKGWEIEISNLPVSSQRELILLKDDISLESQTLIETLDRCATTLRAIDLDEDAEHQELIKITTVEDEYNDWQRVVGLYPLSAWFFKYGINKWHEKTKARYSLPLDQLNPDAKLIQYIPDQENRLLTEKAVSIILERSVQNSLAIPEPTSSDRQRLFDNFAPIFEIDTVNNSDHIGQIVIGDNPFPVVDTNNIVVYQHLSHTHYRDQVLLQLNYTIWFPSRPKTSYFDLLGGHLDGITWRVTLLPNGKVWFYDTIHKCGCYHMIYPTQASDQIPNKSFFEEPILIPQLVKDDPAIRPHIRIANGSHYIERIHFKESENITNKTYKLLEYDVLRSLPTNNGENKSMFSQDGITYSSARNERFLFWPMGIPSPGAMRQWGHHATAFVGKRHFDDARLFEDLFSMTQKNK